MYAEAEARLLLSAAPTPAVLRDQVRRREHGEPLEQILGWADFAGVRVTLRPGVFVPRRRTELLVREAARVARPGSVVVDLCCGSGAIGAALVARVDPLELYAVDLDPTAIACARGNFPGPAATVLRGDLFDALPRGLRGRVDLVTLNAPYVPTAELALLPTEARDHEPAQALDGGPDGLVVHRRVIAEAPRWLAPGGHLIVEVSERQVPAVRREMRRHRMSPRTATSGRLRAVAVGGS